MLYSKDSVLGFQKLDSVKIIDLMSHFEGIFEFCHKLLFNIHFSNTGIDIKHRRI